MPFPPPARTIARDACVFAAQAALVAAVYEGARRIGFTSDAWFVLREMKDGLSEAVTSTLGYHYVPVASALMHACWKAFGLNAARWQLLNLAQFAVVVHIVYHVGRRTLGSSTLAFLGSVLFLANAFFHEIPYWPFNGNIHSLAQSLYLIGILIVLRSDFAEGPAWRHWTLALVTLFAVFTYDGMVTMMPVMAAVLVLRLVRAGEARRLSAWWMLVARPLAPLAIVVALLALAKLVFAKETSVATSPTLDLDRLYWTVRGSIGLFSLRASHDVLHRLLAFGRPGVPDVRAYVVLWTALAIAALLAILWRGRREGPRVLACWLVIHLAFLTVLIPMAPRHGYLPAVPAALLTVWALDLLVRRAAGAFGGEPAPARVALVVVVPVLLLVLWAQRDHQSARLVWGKASRTGVEAVEIVRALSAQRREPVTVCFVNMPGIVMEGGLGAFAFSNGLTDLAHLVSSRRVERVELARTYGARPDLVFANESGLVSIGQVERWAQADDHIVAYYDFVAERVVPLTPATAARPESHLRETSPFLDWRAGSWWWVPLGASNPLDVPLQPSGPDAWLAIRYFQQPGMRLTVSANTEPFVVADAPSANGTWTLASAPMPRSVFDGAPVRLEASAATQVASVWSFSPRTVYDARQAPFLAWADGPPAFAVVPAPLALPLDTSACDPCRLRIGYAGDETRVGEAHLDAGTEVALAPAEGWTTVETTFRPASRSTVLRLKPKGTLPILLMGVEVGPPEGAAQR